MKKILSLLLAMIMVFSLATVAAAETTEEGGTPAPETPATKAETSKPTTLTTPYKAYTVTGAKNAADGAVKNDLYPTETLSFTSVADTANPDKGATNITIDNLVVAGNNDQNLTINIPAFTEVGTYHFTVSETAGSAQGVGYNAGTIAVSVMVTFDYNDEDGDGYLRTAKVGVTQPAEGDKDYELTNTYDVGSLAVSKKVTGNLGDTSKYFKVTVTFTAENGKTVESDITYFGGKMTEVGTIAADWTASKSVEIELKHGDEITFYNIPAGVTYTVVEDDYTDGELNGENCYDDADYNFSDKEKKIAQSDEDTVEITNNKETDVDTGIALDSAPYFLMLAVAVFGMVALVSKKRYEV